MGQPWIHGIGMMKEGPIFLPLDHTAGHILLIGTTRAGKSRTLDSIIAQAVDRGESVIIWDPKGDRGLR
ncbi:MAG: type IV secretion system DNA-binding domain-containing protein, partial [Xanthomonas perforans]|nr:type IV secretion system DNA-binding domain-containing protein [Xanthomonas perforans]